MEFFIARIISGALVVILALISFIIQIPLRKGKLPAIVVRIVSALGAVGSAYLLTRIIGSIQQAAPKPYSLITAYIPQSLFALILAAHFVILLIFAKGPIHKLPVLSDLIAAIAVTLQFALTAVNLLRNWSNFVYGQPEIFYIQLLLTVIPLIAALLIWISYAKGRKAVNSQLAA